MSRGHLGEHIIAEFYRCAPSAISDTDSVEKTMTGAAVISGANIIKPFFHGFSPQGVSGVIIISESHFAIHTWPEHSYAAVDIFTCSGFRYTEALKYIRDRFQSEKYSVKLIRRGLPGLQESPAESLLIEEIFF